MERIDRVWESGRYSALLSYEYFLEGKALIPATSKHKLSAFPAHMKRSNKSKRPNPNQLIIKGTAREL